MIIEQHYDDEILIGLLESGDEAARDKHVSSCHTCAGALESLRAVTTGLQEATVWDQRELPETPNRQIKNAIRGFAAAVSAEDREAESVVRQLLAADSDRSRAMLQRNPEWRTAGVVRRILAAVDDVNFTDPKRAVDLTVLATDIAESLDVTDYPIDTVMKLRATAWRDRAYALYYIGSYTESLAALDRVDERLARCVIPEFDTAQTKLERARVYAATEKFEAAITLAREARAVFTRYGNQKRAVVAEIVEGAALLRTRRFTEGLAIHLRIAENETVEETVKACAMNNAAYCYRELGCFDEAKALYVKTVYTFDRLGMVTLRIGARWNVALVLSAEGRFEQSFEILCELRDEARDLGMAHDLALLSVDAAEALLMLNRRSEVSNFCHAAIEYFAHAGLAYTAPALTALAYVRESAERGTLTVADVHNVRAFIELLPKQPQLQFARPS